MFQISRSDALKLIAKTGPFYANAKSGGNLTTVQVKSGNHINPKALKTFLSVDNWRVLCYDTESDGKMLYKVEPNKGEKGRILIVFGNPAGQSLIFHYSRDTPQELRDRCSDFRYVKFQSGAERSSVRRLLVVRRSRLHPGDRKSKGRRVSRHRQTKFDFNANDLRAPLRQ
jgi:hypothetical protein